MKQITFLEGGERESNHELLRKHWMHVMKGGKLKIRKTNNQQRKMLEITERNAGWSRESAQRQGEDGWKTNVRLVRSVSEGGSQDNYMRQ